MRRLVPFSALPTLAVLAFSAGTAIAQNDYEVGIAYPVISSTYDVHPQIQIAPSEPHARIVPIHKTPLGPDSQPKKDLAPRDRSIRKYIGFEGTEQTPWSPPDPSLAVGPGHVVETVNMNIAWWTKDGTLEFSQRLDDSGSPGFFEDVGAGGFTFDPKCYYDHHHDRFIVLALEVYGSTAYITFAVSDDSDPNGTWYKYRTDAKTRVNGRDYWVDYPGLGGDENAMYVTGNLFGFSGGFAGVKYRIFDLAPIMNGQPTVFFDLVDGSATSAQVAYQARSGEPSYFLSTAGSGAVRVQTIENPLSSPSLRTTVVPVDLFFSPGSSDTLGGGSIDTLDGRIMNAYADGGTIYTAHAISKQGSRQTLSRWYEFQVGSWPQSGDVALTQQGEVKFPGGVDSFFPAIAVNADGDVGMVMARSHSSEYPSVWYTRRFASDQPNMMQKPRELKAGEAGASGRWGDYFDVAIDPADDRTIWGVGEYSKGGWSTWLGTFDFPDDPEYCPEGCNQPTTYGAGTAGTGGIVPSLEPNACPLLGNDGFVLHATDFASNLSGILFLGLGSASLDGGGWTLLVDPNLPSFPILTLPDGSVDFALPIPNNPFLDGLTIYAQFTANDPGAAGGVSATNGLALALCRLD